MTESANTGQPDILLAHQQAHTAFSNKADRSATGWLQSVRERAMQDFSISGFPSTRDEDWKYTSLTKVAERSAAFLGQEPAVADTNSVTQQLAQLTEISGCNSVVFANGQFQRELSNLPEGNTGVTIETLSHANEGLREQVLRHLGENANADSSRLAALNTAFLADGLVITVPADVTLDAPIHVIFTTDNQAGSSQPRILLNLEQNSRAILIEQHIGHGAGLTNAITEIECQKGAHLKYVKLQEESRDAYHLAAQSINMAEDSHVEALHLDLGSLLARNDLRVNLTGTGASADLYGLFLVDGERHIDNHTRMDHLAENTTSRENYRGVIDDRGRGIFNGKIIVHPGADRTDAQMNNRNLVLSRTGEIDTKPELEIYTDDVKCSHGATTGQLDKDAIFYLQTRGVAESEARQMLITAFAREVLNFIEIGALGNYIETAVAERLPV